MTVRCFRALPLSMLICTAPAAADTTIEFNRDIRPILSNHCFVCHGPDNNLRKANLRLDQDKGLYDRADGAPIIAPGKPHESELFKRITSSDRSYRMPPARLNKELTKEQIELIRAWIEQGGKYQRHWSLVPPVRPPVPAVKDTAWVRNPIDAFVLARLEREGLKPAPPADPRTLMRRLSFDLLGLPPTPQEVEDFVREYQASPKPQTVVEKLVDRLLTSQHYGERMA
ncbi:MAG: DUF1549 domain-containing protein, partial [Gemmataceae bacterium]|nr:DUF1549 domain-containing protein [Gemmataceae bacterium]